MQESNAFLVRVQCRRKESSRSLSDLLMSFLVNCLDCYYCGISLPHNNNNVELCTWQQWKWKIHAITHLNG